MTKNWDYYGQALSVTPTGSQTRSKAPGQVGPPLDSQSAFPLFAAYGEGPWLVDVDGRRFLDFAGANAAVPLGYGRKEITDAVTAACDGSLLSLPSAQEVRTSARFTAITGHDMVRWVKTGSEALSAAIRLARVHTGTSVVMYARHSYHGWHDWTQARRDIELNDFDPDTYEVMENGVPMMDRCHLAPFEYAVVSGEGAARAKAATIRRRGVRIAAIVVEPHRFLTREPQVEALEQLRVLADEVGAVLIFDELVYGFRWAIAGATEWCHVQPDLACYGKALGNGVPIACVAGKREVMRNAERAGISGTYGGDRLGLAAADVVMQIYQRENTVVRLYERGMRFMETLAVQLECAVNQLPVEFGAPVHWRFDERALRGTLADVLERCAARHVLFHRSANNASAVMSLAEVDSGATVLGEVLKSVGWRPWR